MRPSTLYTRLQTSSAASVSVFEGSSGEGNEDRGNTKGTEESVDSEGPALVPQPAS